MFVSSPVNLTDSSNNTSEIVYFTYFASRLLFSRVVL